MKLTEKVHAWGPIKLLVMSPDEFKDLRLLMKTIAPHYQKNKDLICEIIQELFPEYNEENALTILKEADRLVEFWREFEKVVGAKG